jgi:HAMP domain-containing protein
MKQPRVPEYRDAEGVRSWIRLAVLFLKDFSMAVWAENNQRKKEIERLSRELDALKNG